MKSVTVSKPSNRRSAYLCAGLASAVVLAASMACAPLSYATETDWEAPTSAKALDNTVAVGAHQGGETMSEMLGLNTTALVTGKSGMNNESTLDEAVKNNKLGIFGSDANQNPDPYFYNYLYNFGASDENKSADAITPTSHYATSASWLISDTDTYGTIADLVKRPNILLGIAGHTSGVDGLFVNTDTTSSLNWSTWYRYQPYVLRIRTWTANKNLIGTNNSDGNAYVSSDYYVSGDEVYDPVGMAYDGNGFSALVNTTHDLAALAESTASSEGLSYRYDETPTSIAMRYEQYVKAIKWYVLSQQAQNKIQKKTVAVVYQADTSANSFKIAVLNPDGDDSSLGSQRVAEAVQDTVYDLAAQVNSNATAGSMITVSAEQLMQSDVIICEDGAASDSQRANESNIKQILAAQGYTDESAYPRIFGSVLPTGTTDLKYTSDSSESAQLIGAIQGFIYPEILDSVDLLCYFFDEFYHIKSTALDMTLANTCTGVSLPNDESLTCASYDKSEVEGILEAGTDYYYDNYEQIRTARPALGASEELDASVGKSSVVKTALEDAASITPITNMTCTGKALKPSVTVKVGSAVLVKGTDYTVAYANNVKPGTATVTVKGTGSYKGTLKTTFAIKLAKGKITKAAVGKKKLTVKWSKVAGAAKYKVSYRVKGKKSWSTKTVKKQSVVLKKLKSNKKYQVKVTAVYGSQKTTTAVTTTKKVK